MSRLLEIWSVESLDTRISTRSNKKVRDRASAPRWKSTEFAFYAICYLVAVPAMFWAAYSAGTRKNPQYHKFADRLTPGWMGRPVDNSDMQYSGFRNQFPLLVSLACGHIVLRRLLPLNRRLYDVIFGIIVISILHGLGGLVKILAILAINKMLLKAPRPRPATWIFGTGILFANELLDGYTILPLGGIIPLWQVFFKCTMLRMISFNMDYLDSDSHNLETSCDFGWANYLGYALYTPLYLAGPIMSYNEFIEQRNTPPATPKQILPSYAIRFVVCMATMELILHFIPIFSITETHAWQGLTPAQVSMVGFFNLVVIWLKLLLPWRFFRLWALLDGIDPPENMLRCVANNYSALSFWRSWHRSFHLWVTRYLYIPLGGSRRPISNSLVVFAFVALWHDIQLRLFVWSGLIVAFVVPEMVARKVLPPSVYGSRWWFRFVAGIGAVGNIWMMLIANLVGFAVGTTGIRTLLAELFATASGLRFAIMCSMLLFVGVQTMFELREREHRAGIDVKC